MSNSPAIFEIPKKWVHEKLINNLDLKFLEQPLVTARAR